MSELRDYLVRLAEFQRNSRASEGRNYSCIEDFVADRGVSFPSARLTKKETEHLTGVVRLAKKAGCRFRAKECFYNAGTLSLADDSGQIRYCEGFAHVHSIPVHHGWNLLNGKVIDLTWPAFPGV